MPSPSYATVIGNGVIQWSDLTPFNGRVVAVLALPTGYSVAHLLGTTPPLRLGTRTEFPIVDGVPDGTFRLVRNDSVTPSGTRWSFFWLSEDGTTLYMPSNPGSELYDVTAATFTLPTVSLVKPAAAAIIQPFPPAPGFTPDVFHSSATVYKSANQTITVDGAIITFDSELSDTGGYHNNSVNNSRLIAPATGIYLATAFISISGEATSSERYVGIKINGGAANIAVSSGVPAIAGANVLYLSASMIYPLNAGEFLEMTTGGTSVVSYIVNGGVAGNGAKFSIARLA